MPPSPPEPRGRVRRPRRWTRPALALGSLLLALVVVEGVLRVVTPVPAYLYPGQLYRAHPTRIYEMVPGFRGRIRHRDYDFTFELNSLGYRDREPTAPPSGPRVWVLGDSFVFGQGVDVDEGLVARLEQALAARGRPARVLNGGVGGYGTFNCVEALRDHVDVLDPDLVVLAVTLGNDFEDNLIYRDVVVREGYLGRADGAPRSRLGLWLLAHSRGLQLARVALRRDAEPVEVDAADQAVQMAEPLPGPVPHFIELCRTGPPTPVVTSMHEAMDAAVGELADEAAARGVPLAAMLLPSPFDTELTEVALRVRAVGLPPEQVDVDRLRGAATAICERHGVPVLDLTPAFRADDRPARLFFPHDPHPSPLGHALVAREAAPWIDGLLGER